MRESTYFVGNTIAQDTVEHETELNTKTQGVENLEEMLGASVDKTVGRGDPDWNQV